MTDNSRSKKRKITIRASPQGVEKAEKALIRLGFETKTNFAKSRFLSRSTVTKFFNFQPIQVDTFKKICKELTLNWQETAEISGDKTSARLEKSDCSRSESNEGIKGDELMQTLRRQVTVLDKDSQETKVVITLEGDINSAPNLKLLESALKTYSGDTIKIIDIQAGSIQLIVEGSQEDIEKLLLNFKSGEIKELNGFPVEDIQVLSESSEDDENNELSDKWRLVEDIVRREVKNRNLRGADLSDADLRGADLSDADLRGADLSDADLSDANLGGADLSDANLGGADLSGADLSGTKLSRAKLSRADLSGADLSDANLKDADLKNADLILANLRDANLSGAFLSGAFLSGAFLKGARIDAQTQINSKWNLVWEILTQGARGRNLRGANLIFADLSGADLSGADLSGADLSDADLSGADLSDANLSGAFLKGADLSGANLSDANLKDAFLIIAKLRDANLRGANLSDAFLRGADLKGARIDAQTQINSKWNLVWEILTQGARGRNLRGANLSGAYLSRANLRDANLRDANLRDANLFIANLRDANLSGANLRDANLFIANLRDANLSGANLSGANLKGADLRDADLRDANLRDASVNNARFEKNSGLTEEMKLDLKRRGAIFEDSPGDRSGVLSRR